jgi:hypothetical protein
MIVNLVRDLTVRGVEFQIRDNKVVLRAPAGTLSQQTKQFLSEHRDELLVVVREMAALDNNTRAAAMSPVQELEHWQKVFGAKQAEPHPHPTPAVVRSHNVVFNGRQVAMTLARHNCSGVNRFGQNARSFPFCVINVERWREHPFDLSRLPWYRSAAHAAEQPREPATEQPISTGSCYVATCGTTRVVLERKARHWLMFVNGTTERCRRRDFASVSLQHSQETAEAWYSPPTDPWREEAT